MKKSLFIEYHNSEWLSVFSLIRSKNEKIFKEDLMAFYEKIESSITDDEFFAIAVKYNVNDGIDFKLFMEILTPNEPYFFPE